jgi:hypothetical protein
MLALTFDDASSLHKILLRRRGGANGFSLLFSWRLSFCTGGNLSPAKSDISGKQKTPTAVCARKSPPGARANLSNSRIKECHLAGIVYLGLNRPHQV